MTSWTVRILSVLLLPLLAFTAVQAFLEALRDPITRARILALGMEPVDG